MRDWLIKTVGIVIATTCAEILLPSGKIKNSCKTVLALLCLTVLIEPIAYLSKNDFDYTLTIPSVQIDNSYVEETERYVAKVIEAELIELLNEKGVMVDDCKIEGSMLDGSFVINKVTVKVSNIGISGKDEHIIGNEELIKLVTDALDISAEKVVLYDTEKE